jgi:hypothetical protein
MRTVLVGVAIAVALCANGCAGSQNDRSGPGAATSSTSAVPPYRLEVRNGRLLDVFVDRMYPAADLERMVAEL